MERIKFDYKEPGGLEIVRLIVFERLRNDNSWKQFDVSGVGYDKYVEYIGDQIFGREKLNFLATEILWECMIQGIIAPGREKGGDFLPWFHITEYGYKVLSTNEYLPHDPTGYLDNIKSEIPNLDDTVFSYLSESLNCFTRDNLIASIVMLGVASERAFLILCDSFLNAISSQKEKNAFQKILNLKAIKPKMDWVVKKVEQIKKALPDNTNIMLSVIFDFIRCQRNDLGHPKEKPPKVMREDAYVYLRLFPNYYKIFNEVITYLSQNKI